MQKIFNDPDIFLETVPTDGIIVTANKRLSLKIKMLYSLKKRPTPTILPFDIWFQNSWNNAVTKGFISAKRILTNTESHYLWRHIIDDAVKTEDKPDVIVESIEEAWELLHKFQIPLPHPCIKTTEEGRYFLACATRYLAWCEKQNAIDHSMLLTEYLAALNARKIPCPAAIFFIGFIEKYPLVHNLMEILSQSNCKIFEIHFEVSSTNPKRLAFTNTRKELQAMIAWAHASAIKNKLNLVGCIVPELNEHRQLLEHIIELDYATETHLFNISSGTPLSKEPIIFIALEILRSIDPRLPIKRISAILRSPFIANGIEQESKRAVLDATLRERKNTFYSPRELTTLLKSDESLTQAFSYLATLDSSSIQTPNAWQKTWLSVLSAFGWPGERSLNEREYSAIKQLHEILEKFSTLNFIATTLDCSIALDWFHTLLAKTLFQPPSLDNAPIQILGMLEANDLLFDACWIAGLDDHSWPKPPAPNPFLPLKLERQYDMPHSSYDRELQFSKLMTKHFLKRSKQVIFSYAMQEQEILLKPSALIREFPADDISRYEHDVLSPPPEKLLPELPQKDGEEAPSVAKQKTYRGGSRIFKLQAACPFRAFAELLLKSSSIIEPKDGIDRLDRGKLVHKTLELFWKATKSHEALISLSNRALQERIHICILQACKQILINRNLSQTMIDVETDCLHQLLDSWLSFEKERPPFEIYALEKRSEIFLGGLKLNIVIDRIDRLKLSDSFLLIDYKTSHSHINDWFGDRPEDPQLPLYAVTSPLKISAIAYVELRPENIKMHGIAAKEDIHPSLLTLAELRPNADIETTWDIQCARWLETLTALAKAFSSGYFPVDPKNPKLTCKHCKAASLCRINAKDSK